MYRAMSHIVVLSTALERGTSALGRRPLAGLNGGIPVLWNLLFEEADLSRGVRDAGDVVTATTTKALALDRLARRTPRYCELMSEPALAEYTALLAESLRQTGGDFLTMDLSHLAAQSPRGALYEAYAQLLARLSAAYETSASDPELRTRILDASGYAENRKFPPARLLLDADHPPWEDTQDHARVIGASWTGCLAWERAPKH